MHSSFLTIHDFYTHAGEQSKYIEKLQRKAILKANRVICLTEYVSQQISSALGAKISCTVLPHPILPTRAKNSLAPSSRPKLLALGRMVDYKGIDLLCAAVSALDIEVLTIAGLQKQKVSTRDSKINIIDKVLSTWEIAELLEQHHLLILPYKEASQSGVLMLGIAAHMVMVITKVGGLPEQLSEHAALWVEPNINSLKQGIQNLMDNPEAYKSIKAEVRHYTDQHVQKDA
jgi:glycosyltransferase involved in cell wall biosynthesis